MVDRSEGMNLIESYFYGKNDTRLFVRRDIPSKARAIVVIAHGYMEHSGRYLDFAQCLVQANIGVCIIDHRGNGRSGGDQGDVEDFFDLVEDIHCLINVLKKYNKPIFTFGHSMGGLITFLYGLKYKEHIHGQIFSSPALGVPIGCKNFPSALYESMAQVAGHVKIKVGGEGFSTRNQHYIKQFKADLENNDYYTIRFMDQFLRVGVGYANAYAKDYAVPSLFLMGDCDRVIPISRNREILKKIPYEDKVIKAYKGCMHDLLHDLEEEVERMTQDILVWLDKRIKTINI